MGYGYPAALGVKVAHPDKEVIDIDGDGSFLMNIQELATAHVEKIAAKAIILNNQHLGMVVQWEDNFYAGNRGHTYLGDPDHRAEIYPDYVRVCNSFGVPCERVMFKKDLRAALQKMLDRKNALRPRRGDALQRTRVAVHSGGTNGGGHGLEGVIEIASACFKTLAPRVGTETERRRFTLFLLDETALARLLLNGRQILHYCTKLLLAFEVRNN